MFRPISSYLVFRPWTHPMFRAEPVVEAGKMAPSRELDWPSDERGKTIGVFAPCGSVFQHVFLPVFGTVVTSDLHRLGLVRRATRETSDQSGSVFRFGRVQTEQTDVDECKPVVSCRIARAVHTRPTPSWYFNSSNAFLLRPQHGGSASNSIRFAQLPSKWFVE